MKTNDFEYNYSAPTTRERKEIESIRNSYLPSVQTDKLKKLRNLDNKVKNTPTIYALVLGIIGVLVFGLGLSMVLEWNMLLWGVIVSVVGAVIMLIAYPIYKTIAKKLRNKYSNEIIKLSEELLNEK